MIFSNMDIPMQIESKPASPASGVKHPKFKGALLILPLVWLWFHLIHNLWFQWTTDPQYSYGLVVPLLTAGLLIRRWHRFSGFHLQNGELSQSRLLIAFIASLVLVYLPVRLLEEAVPEWRPIGWVLAVETIGLTLYAIYVFKGWHGLVRFAFPFCFFFTAVPWPTLFEQPIIQHLSRINAAIVVNVMSILGVPAIQHGNVIEISTGMVGINDACSGIRSLQSSLMISLFLGEFYFLKWPRRLFLILAGFVLAMFFNACRTSLLTFLAAKKGIGAIAHYHDEAGITILFACTATLWGVSYLISVLRNRASVAPNTAPASAELGSSERRQQLLSFFAAGLTVWILLVEGGVHLWYSIRESHISPGPKWSLVLPTNDSTFKPLPVTPEEETLLRFDDERQGQWQEPDGTVWQAFYFDWLPGRVAGYLAKRHTPDICLSAEGLTMTSGPVLTMMNIHDIELPMRCYVFTGPDGPLQVFQCHWQPGADKEAYADESSRYNLIRGVWTGRGDKGQKVIEIVITGYHDSQAAREALAQELQKLIKVEKKQA